jgi:DNA-binding NarL/FixJ family response regulator
MAPRRGRRQPELVTSILVVDDHPLVRAGLANLLRLEAGFGPVRVAAGVREAIAEYTRARPDVVTVDFRLSDGDGLSLCRRLERLDASAGMAVVSAYASDELEVAAAAAGARRVVRKGGAPEDLIAAVRAIADGDELIAPHPRLVRRAIARIDPRDRPVLTHRLERLGPAEIARMLAQPVDDVQVAIDRIVDRLKPRYWRPRRLVASPSPSRL